MSKRPKIVKLFFPHDHKLDHFSALDGLRGVAVLLVLLSHTSNANLMFHKWLNFQEVGRVGVYLFFVLSAYLLDRQIAIVLMSKRSTKQYWKNYVLRRFLRIYPLFVIALLVYGLFNLIGFPTVIKSFKDLYMHILLLDGKSIFWSIPVEFKYYFLSPLIMWFFDRVLGWNLWKVLTVLLLMTGTAIYVELSYQLSDVSTFRFLPIFLVGTFISIYELLRKRSVFTKLPTQLFDVLGILCAFLIVISIPFYFTILFDSRVDFHKSIYYTAFAIIWGCILISSKYGNGIIKRILQWKVLRFYGAISYSAYLFHMVVLIFIQQTDLFPQGSKIYFFFLITTIISALSYLFIERPLSKIKIYKSEITEDNLKKSSLSTEKHVAQN